MEDLAPISENLNVIDECGNLIKISIFIDEPQEFYYMSYFMVVHIFVLDSNDRSFMSKISVSHEDILRDISKYSICYLSKYPGYGCCKNTFINMVTSDGKIIELEEERVEDYHLLHIRKEIERLTMIEDKLKSIYPK